MQISYEEQGEQPCNPADQKSWSYVAIVQRAALGQSQGLVKSLPESPTGWLAILQLLCSQERRNLQEELLKRNKQNLDDRPSAAGCSKLKEIIN